MRLEEIDAEAALAFERLDVGLLSPTLPRPAHREFGDEVQLRASELQLAQQLIEQLASERFGPERYEDRYRQAVLAAVELPSSQSS